MTSTLGATAATSSGADAPVLDVQGLRKVFNVG